ncbi:MAG: ribonuclease HI family protein [Armatimonadetes bacterium]|nr:ribonuclease HI family protein [Armatimonadota bacterium]
MPLPPLPTEAIARRIHCREDNRVLEVRLYTDGACSGNPGPAGIGFAILATDGQELAAVGEAIGHATNNIAEYTALIRGLEHCALLGATHVEVVSDSELMVRQLTGRYRVKNANMIPLYEQAKALAKGFEKVTFRHVLRGENQRADGLASGSIRGRR